MAAVADYTELIRSVFLTPTKNDAHIHGIQFYIRGKPWVISIDDYLLFRNDEETNNKTLFFGMPDASLKKMWGAILEKAYAKTLGSYS